MTEVSLENLNEFAKNLVEDFKKFKIITLSGDLGAGKTRFTKALGKAIRINPDYISSPTFNILNIYDSEIGEIYHFDLYRLEDKAEIYNIGLEDALDEQYCIIEWPEIAKSLLPNRIDIKILNKDDNLKRIYY